MEIKIDKDRVVLSMFSGTEVWNLVRHKNGEIYIEPEDREDCPWGGFIMNPDNKESALKLCNPYSRYEKKQRSLYNQKKLELGAERDKTLNKTYHHMKRYVATSLPSDSELRFANIDNATEGYALYHDPVGGKLVNLGCVINKAKGLFGWYDATMYFRFARNRLKQRKMTEKEYNHLNNSSLEFISDEMLNGQYQFK